MWNSLTPRAPQFSQSESGPSIFGRLAALTLTLALFALPGAALAASTKTTVSGQVTEVFLIRGFLGVFSTGLDGMAKDLGKARIRTEVHGHLGASAIRAKIVRQRSKSSRKRHRLVLVGHSFGGNAALSVAKQLRAHDIKVDLVVTVDPTRSGPVSDNVRRYVNYYFPGNGLGAKLAPRGLSAKRIRNVDMRKRVDVDGDDHWTVTHNAAIQREILSAIKRAVR